MPLVLLTDDTLPKQRFLILFFLSSLCVCMCTASVVQQYISANGGSLYPILDEGGMQLGIATTYALHHSYVCHCSFHFSVGGFMCHVWDPGLRRRKDRRPGESNSPAAAHGEPDSSFGEWRHLAHRCQIEARQWKSQVWKTGAHDDFGFPEN